MYKWTEHLSTNTSFIYLKVTFIGQVYINKELKMSPGKFWGRNRDVIKQYDVPILSSI